MVPLDWVQLVAAALAPFFVGTIWYHPRVFGTRWMSLKHITPEMAERSARLEAHSTALMLALGIVSALVLRMIVAALQVYTATDALLLAFGIWLAFVVPGSVNRVLWDHAPVQLYLIESGQWLVSLILMAVVLAYV